MMSISEKLDVFGEPIFDNSIMSLQEHTYKPYGSPSFKENDQIRIPIQFQDLILDVSESYLYIEGTFKPADAAKRCYMSNNALAFLFDEISYEIGGEQVVHVRKPGVTSALKTMVSFGALHQRSLLACGWGLDENNQAIVDPTSHVFSGKLPLKYLMGFAEDYNKAIFNMKQELILLIAHSFKNCYIGEVDAEIKIDKIEWKIRHITPSDSPRVDILTRMQKGGIKANIQTVYRKWDLYELPALRDTSSDVWALRTTTNLEKPRYVIIGFQDSTIDGNREKDATQFTTADISDIRLYLNSSVFPYERWNLDFTKKLYAPAYYNYENFQSSYYGREMIDPMMSFSEYLNNPIFVIDCSRQPEALKLSTIDIKMEFQTRKSKFPKNTKVWALVIHDSVFNYNMANNL